MKNNTLVCDDSLYTLDAAYLAGARAMRQRIPWSTGNPYADRSQKYDQWSYGHVNESADEHLCEGVDVIEAPRNGRRFFKQAKGK